MICSTAELNLGTDHSGILVLPAGHRRAGNAAAGLLGLDDVVFHSAITPDRGYRLSGARHGPRNRQRQRPRLCRSRRRRSLPRGRGFARDHRPGGVMIRAAAGDRDDPTAVSPWWMQRRLLLSGIRAISPAVDVTNYVMLELGPDARPRPQLITGAFRVRFAETGRSWSRSTTSNAAQPGDVLIVDDVATAAIGGVWWRHDRGPRHHHRRASRGRGLGSAAVSRTQRRLHLPAKPAAATSAPSIRLFPLRPWTDARL